MDSTVSGGIDPARHHEEPDFSGNWRDFLKMQLVNLLLMVVTLGIYRFWAATKVRRYLWSHTSVYGSAFNYTGTGGELFKGFLIVFIVFGVPILLLSFWLQTLILQGRVGLVAGIYVLLFVIGGFFYCLARFRMTRYRLTRTYWQGIRGGSDDNGINYAGKGLGWMALGLISLWLLTPVVVCKLFAGIWNKMSFGDRDFSSNPSAKPLYKAFLASVIVVVGGSVLLGFVASAVMGSAPAAALLTVLATYALLVFAFLIFTAATWREFMGTLSHGELDFRFHATAADWFKLYVGNILLAVVTLGFGILMWPYRNWRFYTRHFAIIGKPDLDQLSQSQTAAPREGEGLADSFDIGAI